MLEQVAIATGSSLAYAGTGVGIAKAQFTYLRNLEIDRKYRDYISYKKPEEAIERAVAWADDFNELNMVPAIFMGLFWPVAAPLVFGTRALTKWFNATTTKSKAELEVERLLMTKRIQELEKELGL